MSTHSATALNRAAWTVETVADGYVIHSKRYRIAELVCDLIAAELAEDRDAPGPDEQSEDDQYDPQQDGATHEHDDAGDHEDHGEDPEQGHGDTVPRWSDDEAEKILQRVMADMGGRGVLAWIAGPEMKGLMCHCGAVLEVRPNVAGGGQYVCENGHVVGGWGTGGQLDIGIVHDPDLMRRNEVKFFVESYVGIEPLGTVRRPGDCLHPSLALVRHLDGRTTCSDCTEVVEQGPPVPPTPDEWPEGPHDGS